jgi:Undecaprenyl-phosphate glucose phosphotransferase
MFRAADVGFVTVATVVTLFQVVDGPVLQMPVAQLAPFALGAVLLAHVLRASGAYRLERSQHLLQHLAQIVLIAALVGVGVALAVPLLDAADPAESAAWRWTLIVVVGLTALHLTWYLLVRRWRAQGWLTPNIVLVGATARAERLINEAIARRDINVLGVFDDRLARSPLAILGVPLLGNTEALVNHRVTPHVDLIVVTVDPSATARVREIMARLSVLPNAITLMVDQDEETARIAAVAHLADAPLAPLGRAADPERKAFAKRIQDLVIGIPMLIIATPLMVLAAIAVKLDSRGPVFFTQRRHGFNNEEIMVHKFRTMRQETSDAKAERQVTAGDDRITRVGRFLRKSSLDELPQLFNVLHGEMSLVGPRPHAIGMKTGETESAQLVSEYAHRHRIKPGMTGWAAINGSRGPLHLPAEVKRRVALDVEYIERQSLWLDLKIMLLTLPSFLGDRSAVR